MRRKCWLFLKEKKLTAKGIYGIFPANQVNDDDIELTDENGKALQTFLTLRQQSQKTKAPNIACRTLLLQKILVRIIGAFLCNYRFWC
jgi:5-methyltetrahydrofolate--homocysteine methyltransferase